MEFARSENVSAETPEQQRAVKTKEYQYWCYNIVKVRPRFYDGIGWCDACVHLRQKKTVADPAGKVTDSNDEGDVLEDSYTDRVVRFRMSAWTAPTVIDQ